MPRDSPRPQRARSHIPLAWSPIPAAEKPPEGSVDQHETSQEPPAPRSAHRAGVPWLRALHWGQLGPVSAQAGAGTFP